MDTYDYYSRAMSNYEIEFTKVNTVTLELRKKKLNITKSMPNISKATEVTKEEILSTKKSLDC